jgi:hypothetical protein
MLKQILTIVNAVKAPLSLITLALVLFIVSYIYTLNCEAVNNNMKISSLICLTLVCISVIAFGAVIYIKADKAGKHRQIDTAKMNQTLMEFYRLQETMIRNFDNLCDNEPMRMKKFDRISELIDEDIFEPVVYLKED